MKISDVFYAKMFFSSIDKRECFKNLKYFENVSSICENNVNFGFFKSNTLYYS